MPDIGAAVLVHPGQVQGLLPSLRTGRVQGTDDHYLRGYLQQRSAGYLAIAQSGLRCRMLARPTIATQAPWSSEQVQGWTEEHLGGYRRCFQRP